MELTRRFLWVVAAACTLSILLLIWGHFVDTPFWGLLTSRCMNTALFMVMVIAGMGVLLASFVAKWDSNLQDQARGLNPVVVGLVAAVLGMIVLLLFSGGGYFWRNLVSGPISIFGSYSDVAASYSDLPPNPDLVELWEQTGSARMVTVLLGGVYLFLLAFIAAEIAGDRRTGLLVLLFAGTSGLLALFTSSGDFSILLVLSALNVILILQFLKGRVSIYVVGVVLLISVFWNPVFILPALALLYVRASGPLMSHDKPGVPLILLLVIAALGVGLSVLQVTPFVSVFRPETTASPVFDGSQLRGFANQMLMVSHLIWLVALVTVVYMFVTSRVKEFHGLLFGAWFVAASAFYLPSYSVYGWIFGYPSGAIVVLPAILWLMYFMSRFNRADAAKGLIAFTVVNVLVAASLLAAVHSKSCAVEQFASHVSEETAFDPKFNDGVGSLLLGVMYSEHLEMYPEAVTHLEAFHQRYPLNPVGTYYYSWALTNVQGRLIDGLNILRELNERLLEENKVFWEFNYRIGWTLMRGHNAYLASMPLERAAAERNTAEIAYLLGVCYEGIKAPDSMASKYEQAIALGDSSRENFYKVALACEKLGDTAKALTYFRYGIEHFPDYVPNYQSVAREFFLNQMYDSLETLARFGLGHLARSAELEACMIMVYHYTDRPEQMDSAYAAFMDYYRTYPEALYSWGIFLEENGLIYEGRKMQAADITVDWLNLKSILTFYHYYRDHDLPDSARVLIDRYAEAETTTAVLEVLEAVKRYDTILWPGGTSGE